MVRDGYKLGFLLHRPANWPQRGFNRVAGWSEDLYIFFIVIQVLGILIDCPKTGKTAPKCPKTGKIGSKIYFWAKTGFGSSQADLAVAELAMAGPKKGTYALCSA